MTIDFDNNLFLESDVTNAWDVLLDVPAVVSCLPGVRLDELVTQKVFKAIATLKIGPMKLEFLGDGELYDIDPASHSAKLRSQGKDKKGRGHFKIDMFFELTKLDKGCELLVNSRLDLTGSIAQFGRTSGMARDIANNIVQDFGANLNNVLKEREVNLFKDNQYLEKNFSVLPSEPKKRKNKELSILFLVYKAIINRIRRFFVR